MKQQCTYMSPDLVTHEVGDFDYGEAKSKTKQSFKTTLAVSSTSHDRGDRVTRLIKTKKAMPKKVYFDVPGNAELDAD